MKLICWLVMMGKVAIPEIFEYEFKKIFFLSDLVLIFIFFFTRNGCKQKRILKDDCVCVCVVSTFLFIEILSRVNVIGV